MEKSIRKQLKKVKKSKTSKDKQIKKKGKGEETDKYTNER